MDTMETTPKVISTNPKTSIQTSFLRTDRPTRSTGSVSACSDCSDTNIRTSVRVCDAPVLF